MSKLTPKQKIFVDEYLVDLNATRAYKVAYPSCKKEETINAAASRMLRNVKVKGYIDKRMKDREKRTEITQDFVLKELYSIAAAKGSDFSKIVEKSYMKPILDKEGNKIDGEEVFYKDVEFVLTDDLPEDKKKAIAAIKQTKYGIEVATCDKVRALELLGKHLGMFTDKIEHSGTISNDVSIIIDGEEYGD
ncbi:terminase small subunit [Clostridium algidicarnis]|uniref:terminase small subunit n=1 Tax=Clostridium algidicarnis TaxID=37659 RepID=UPI001C0DF1F0|nr:terminase small subunit [Clostridium algidicarnis]MBU3193480.1 terminase small subunit [Clostridium algidicarnis]MBU3203114.1 terminase small subunit [Clostridium algidicarnis]MBU3211268.1 terminase small subunit [Clostridium algidicarnis]MBU3222224.1 terminase small subunit [Clostridium algidicarnis]